jgi:hypothetical protein
MIPDDFRIVEKPCDILSAIINYINDTWITDNVIIYNEYMYFTIDTSEFKIKLDEAVLGGPNIILFVHDDYDIRCQAYFDRIIAIIKLHECECFDELYSTVEKYLNGGLR